MRIDLYIHGGQSIEQKLDGIVVLLEGLMAQGRIMAGELSTLQGKVAENKSAIQSAIVLLTGLKAKLDEAIASDDPAALTALSASLGTDTQRLAEAVVANTPAEE